MDEGADAVVVVPPPPWYPCLFLNALTSSLFALQGMRSSGEFPSTPQLGQAAFSLAASVRAFRAHSSQQAHPQLGIMMASRRRSLQIGQRRSSGISTLGIEERLDSSTSQSGLSILLWRYAFASISFTMYMPIQTLGRRICGVLL